IDIVTFVVTQGAQIIEFVNAILDAVIAIAGGGAAGVPKMVESALAASIPVLLGVLASLLGIGSLAGKVRQVFQTAARPVNRAIDKIVDFIAKQGKKLWAKLKGKGKNVDDRGTGTASGKGKGKEQAEKGDAFSDVARDVKSGLGRSPSADKAASVAESTFSRYQSRGLKLLHFSPNKKRPGEFEVLVRASPLRRALVFRVSDLQLSFPRTACILHVTEPSGKQENLGKFLVQRKPTGAADGDTSHHAEQHMIGILRSRYFTGDRPKGKYTLQLSLTRRPCQGCGPALEDFKNELQGKGYEVEFRVRIVSAYAAEGEDVAIKVLKSLSDKGFELNTLSLEQIVAEELLNDPGKDLTNDEKQILANEKNKVEEYLNKAGVKKGT
ncbi:hypothetical protein ACF08Y_28255, partial [Streptomyces pactum]